MVVSNAQLNTSLALGAYTCVLSNSSAMRDLSRFVSGLTSSLDAFSSYSNGAWLPCLLANNRQTRGAGSMFLSYLSILPFKRPNNPKRCNRTVYVAPSRTLKQFKTKHFIRMSRIKTIVKLQNLLAPVNHQRVHARFTPFLHVRPANAAAPDSEFGNDFPYFAQNTLVGLSQINPNVLFRNVQSRFLEGINASLRIEKTPDVSRFQLSRAV